MVLCLRDVNIAIFYPCLAWQPSLSCTSIEISMLVKSTLILMLSYKLFLIAKQIARLGK